MLGTLGTWDLVWVVCVAAVVSGGSATYAYVNSADRARLRRMEGKLDRILKHLGVAYKDPATADGLSEEVRALADDPRKKIPAIKLHRQQTGASLREAKRAVDAYRAAGRTCSTESDGRERR